MHCRSSRGQPGSLAALLHILVEQVKIILVPQHQNLMRPDIRDHAILDKQVEIGEKDVRIMRDKESGPTANCFPEVGRNSQHRLGVQAGTRLIKDQDPLLPAKKLSNTDTPALTE